MPRTIGSVLLFAMLTGCAVDAAPEEQSSTTSNVTNGNADKLVFERTDAVPADWQAVYADEDEPKRLSLGFLEAVDAAAAPLVAHNDRFDAVTQSATSVGTCETFNGTTKDAQIPSGTVISLERIKIVRPDDAPPFVAMEGESIEVGAKPVFLTVHCAYTEGMTIGELADALGPTVKAAPLR